MVAPTLHLNWHNPVAIRLEPGLLQALQPHGHFIVLADPQVIDMGTEAVLRQKWGALCVQWVWQREKISSLQAAQSLAEDIWPVLRAHPDAALWAIGGGTTLDLAKLLRWRFEATTVALSSWQNNRLLAPAVRHTLWCSPSTHGTGSEVTPWATVWDLQATPPCKRSWHPEKGGHPDHAWIDPLLGLSCPQKVSRDSGLDALSHALESIWNRHANRLSRPIALEAARLVMDNLPLLLNDPDNTGLRTRMAHASLLAGLAMSQTQTALAHALSYQLTLEENMPHGEACAVWLPMAMEIAAARSAQVRHDLESIFRMPIEHCVVRMQDWLNTLGVSPRDLRASLAGQHRLEEALMSARGRNFIEDSSL
jgi:alcohol dehydrogenase